MMVEEFKASPKRELKSTKGKKFSKTCLLEILAQGGSIASYTTEDGTVKMKILVKKQDLKRIMNNTSTGTNRDRTNNASSISSSSIERRLYDLMKKKKKPSKSSNWMPVLQSIPEE